MQSQVNMKYLCGVAKFVSALHIKSILIPLSQAIAFDQCMRASEPYWLNDWNITIKTHAQYSLTFTSTLQWIIYNYGSIDLSFQMNSAICKTFQFRFTRLKPPQRRCVCLYTFKCVQTIDIECYKCVKIWLFLNEIANITCHAMSCHGFLSVIISSLMFFLLWFKYTYK